MERPPITAQERTPHGDDENGLPAELRAGNDAAFERLVRDHGGRMLLVARRILSNEADAQDALQEAFVSAFRSIDRFAGESSLATWLHRIVVNAALMKRRSQRRSHERAIEEMLPSFLDDGHQADPAVPWRDSLEATVERREMRELVRRCIDELPETYRTVLLLRDIEQLDTIATARLLGIEVGAVKTRLHRARQALRTILDPHLREEDA